MSSLIHMALFIRFSVASIERMRFVLRGSSNGGTRKPDLPQDQNWLCSPSGSMQPSPEMIGRVKEVDEATKAQLAAVREVGQEFFNLCQFYTADI
jgi:hypothetical protein